MPVAHGCREILVVAGRLVLTGELTQTGHSAALAASLAAVRPVDAALVFLAEEKPRSAVGADFLHGQPFSDQLVLVPWEVERWGVDGRRLVDDAEAVEKLADLYRVQVQVPVGSARSARLVPVDRTGRETSWDDAVAVRSLPWSHVAAREAVRTAIEIASDRTSPSWTRIEALAGRLTESHQRLRVPVPTAAVAMAFRLVRHGLPPGMDATAPAVKVMPASVTDVLSLTGGEPVPTGDVDALFDGLLRVPDSTALVRLRPGAGTGGLGWLVPHDGVVWWFGASPAPGGGTGPIAAPVGEGWLAAAIREPETRMVVVDADGGATTLDALLRDVVEVRAPGGVNSVMTPPLRPGEYVLPAADAEAAPKTWPPPHTVGVFADGSYAVAKPPPDDVDRRYGSTGFLIFGPDGRPRGRYDIHTFEENDHVAMSQLHNHSDIPGALDLAAFYVTEHSSKPYFQLVSVINAKLQQTSGDDYGMALLPGSKAGSRDYRAAREPINRIARQRLSASGWSLAPDGGTAATPPFGPARDADGRLRTPAAAEPILSSSEAGYFYRLARSVRWESASDALGQAWHRMQRAGGLRTEADKAREFVQYVVDTGQEVRPDLLLDGYRVYRATVNGKTVTARARVLPYGTDGRRVVAARRPMPLDRMLERFGGEEMLADLRRFGWPIRISHESRFVASSAGVATPELHVDPFDDRSWPVVQRAHRALLGAADTEDVHLFRSAHPDLREAVRARVRQTYPRLIGRHGVESQWQAWKGVARVIGRQTGSPTLVGRDQLSQPSHLSHGSFSADVWNVHLDLGQSLDSTLRTLAHEMLHVEHAAMIAWWRAGREGPEVYAQSTTSPEVQEILRDGRPADDDPRYPAAGRMWHDSRSRPRGQWVNVALDAVGDLVGRAEMRLDSARRLDRFGPRVLRRLETGRDRARLAEASVHSVYRNDPTEAQAFRLELTLAADGSVRDWHVEVDGLVDVLAEPGALSLGPAGVFLPRTPTASPPQRLPHPDRPLVVVEVRDVADARRRLTDLRAALPTDALVELLPAARLSAADVVSLADVLGDDHVLAVGRDLVDSAAGQLVAHTRAHQPTITPFAAYYTRHAVPQRDIPVGDMFTLSARDDGRFEMLPGWHVVTVGDRVWIGSADASPRIADDDPRVVIGTPDRPVPWTVWQYGMWVARALASHTGAVADADFVRVHRPEPPVSPRPWPSTASLHAETAHDRRLLDLAFGAQWQEALPTSGSVPARVGHYLLDALLDEAGADPAERDPAALVAHLDRYAERLRLPRTTAGPVAARRELLRRLWRDAGMYYGILAEFDPQTPPGSTAAHPDDHLELDASPPDPAEEPVVVGPQPPAVLVPGRFPLLVDELLFVSEPDTEDAADEAPSDPMDIDTSPEADETGSDAMTVDALSEADDAPNERVEGLAASLVRDHAPHLLNARWEATAFDTAVTNQRVVLRDLLSVEQLTRWRTSGLFDSGVVLRPARGSRPDDQGVRLVVRADPADAYQHVDTAESAQWYAAPFLMTVRWEHPGRPSNDLPVVRAALVRLRALVSDEVLSGPQSRVTRRGAELVGVDEKLAATVGRLNPATLDLPPETLRRGLARVAAIDPVSVRTLHDAVVAEVEVGRWRAAGRQLTRADTVHQVLSGPGLSGLLGVALRPQGTVAGPLRIRMAMVDALPLGTLSRDGVVYQRVRVGLLVQVEPAEARGLPQLVFRLDGALELALDPPTAARLRQETPPPAYQRVWERDEPVSEAAPTVPTVTPTVDQQPQTDDFHGDEWTRLVSDLGVTGPDEARTRQWGRLIESVPDPDEVTDLTVEAISAVHGPLPTDAEVRASADLVEPVRRAWYAVAQDLGLPPGALRILGAELVTVVRTRTTGTRATADELLIGLRERLGPFGVSTDVEVVYLAELSARLGLGQDDLASFRWLSERGVPLELVHTLPDRLAGRSVAWAAEQVHRSDDVDGVAADLGLFLGSVGPDEAARKVRSTLRSLALTALAGQLGLGPSAVSATEREHPTAAPGAPPVDGAEDPPGGRPSERLETTGKIDLAGLLAIREMIRTAARVIGMRADRVRPAEVGTLVERVVDQVRLIAEELGFKSPQHVTRYAELSGGLGFPVTELSDLLPSGHLATLVYRLVGNVPMPQITRFLDEVAPARPIRQSADREPEPTSTSTRWSVREAAGWADRWEVPEEQVRAVAALPLVDLSRVARMVDRLHLPKEQIARLLDVIATTGQVPDRLDWFAYRAGVEPEVALELAWRLNTNILDLLPMRAVLHRLAVHAPERSDDRLTVEHLVRLLSQGPHGEPVPPPAWTFWVGAHLPTGSGADGLTPNELHDLVFSRFRVGHASVAEYHQRLMGLDWIGLLEQAMDDSAGRFDEDEPPPVRPQLPAARDADLWLAQWLAEQVGIPPHEVESDLIDRPWLDHVAVLDAARDLAVPVPTALTYARRWGGLKASDVPPLPPDAHPDTVTWLFGMSARWDVPLVQFGPIAAAMPRQQDPPTPIPAIPDNVLRRLWPTRVSFGETDTFWAAQVPLAFLTDWRLAPTDWTGDQVDLGWWLTSVLGLPSATNTSRPGSAMDIDSDVGTASESDVEMADESDDETSSVSHVEPLESLVEQLWDELTDHHRAQYLTTLSEVADQLGLDLHRRYELSTALRVSVWWVTGFSVRIGQVPDIEHHASRLGVPSDKLFALASVLGVDPAVLGPQDDLTRLNDADEAGVMRFAAVGAVADSIRNRPDWRSRQMTDTITDHLYAIVFAQTSVPPKLVHQLNDDGRWLGLRGLLEGAARADVPAESLAVYANLSRPPKTAGGGAAGPSQVIEAYQRRQRSDEATYGLDTSDLWPVWNHDGSATLARGDVAEVSAAALRYAEPYQRAEVFRRITAHAGRQDAPQNVAGLIRAMGAAAGPDSAPHEWLSPLLRDAPVPDGMSISLLSSLSGASDEVKNTFANLSDIAGVRVGRPTDGRYSLQFTFGSAWGGWAGLADVLDTLRDLKFTINQATVEVRTGYGADAAAYLRLAHLYYAHLNALSQIGLANRRNPPPQYGFSSFAGFLRAHREASGLSVRVAWSSDDVVGLRLDARKELLWPGIPQAGLRIIAEMVELARRPFPDPQWWDWTFRPPGDHADDAFELGLDGWRLVGLLADESTRAQAAALLTIFRPERKASDHPMAWGLGPVRDDPTIPETLPQTHEVPDAGLLAEILPAGRSTAGLAAAAAVTARLTDPELGMSYRAAVVRAAGGRPVFVPGRVPGDQPVSDVLRQLISGQLTLPDEAIRAAYHAVAQAPDTAALRGLLGRDGWDALILDPTTVDARLGRPRVRRDTLPATFEANASDRHGRWPDPSQTVDWLRHRIGAGRPPVPYFLANALGRLGDPGSGRTFALTIDGMWSDDVPGEPWTWVAAEDRWDPFADALAAAQSALATAQSATVPDSRRSRLRIEPDPEEVDQFVVHATELVDSPPVWRALGAVVEAMRRYGVFVQRMAITADHAPLPTARTGQSVDRTAALDRLVRAHEDTLTRLFGSPELPWLNPVDPPEVGAAGSRPHAVEVGVTYPGILATGLGGLQGGVLVVLALLAATARASVAASDLPDSDADPVGTNFATTRSEPQQVDGWFLDPSGEPQITALLAALRLDQAESAQVAALFHLNSWYPPPDSPPARARGMGDRAVWPISTRSEHPAAFVAAVAGTTPAMAARDAVTGLETLRLPLDYLRGVQRRADAYLRSAPPVTDAATALTLREASVAGLWEELGRSGATIGAWHERFQREQVGLGDLAGDGESPPGPIPSLTAEARSVLDTVPTSGATVEDAAVLGSVASWLTSRTRPRMEVAVESEVELLRREIADRLHAGTPAPLLAAATSAVERQWAHRGLLGAVLDAAAWQGVPLPPEIHAPRHLRDFVTSLVAAEPARFADVGGGRGALLAEELPFSTLSALLAGFRAPEPTPEQLSRWQAEASAAVRRRLPDADGHTIREAVLAATGARVREHRRSQWRAEFARRVERPTPQFKAQLMRALTNVDPHRVRLVQLVIDASATSTRHLQEGLAQVDLHATALGRHLPEAIARALDVNIVVHSDQSPTVQTYPGPRPVLHLSRVDRGSAEVFDRYQPYPSAVSAGPAPSLTGRLADTMDPRLWRFAQDWVRERYPLLDGSRGWNEQRIAWYRLVELLAQWIDVPMMATFIATGEDRAQATFDPMPWRMDLTVASVDEALVELLPELLVAEVVTMQAQAETHKSQMSRHTADENAVEHMWNTRDPGDERHEEWPRHYTQARLQRDDVKRAGDLLWEAGRRSSTILPFPGLTRLRRRLTQGWTAARWEYANTLTRIERYDSVAQTQFDLQQQLRKLGSTRDWRKTPHTQMREIDGFESVDLGPAGTFLRPAGSHTAPPARMSSATQRLVVVEVGDAATAPHVLTQILDGLPDTAIIELMMSGPVNAPQAIELARLIGDNRTLVLASNLVVPGDLSDHFAAHSRSLTPTFGPVAAYYAVNPEPRPHAVDIAGLLLRHLGAGRYEFLTGWDVVTVGDRLWIRPTDYRGELPYSGAARIVIGAPGQPTPWTVEQFGQKIASTVTIAADLALQGFVHTLGRTAPMSRPPRPNRSVINPVDEPDRQLHQQAFGRGHPGNELVVPVGAGPEAAQETLTLGHVVDILLDLAGADPAESDIQVLLGRLDQLAVQQGIPRDDTTPNGAQRARRALLKRARDKLSEAGLAGLLAEIPPPPDVVELTASPPEPAEAPVVVRAPDPDPADAGHPAADDDGHTGRTGTAQTRQPALLPVQAGVYLPPVDHDIVRPPVIDSMPRYQSYVSAFATLDPATTELVAGTRRYGPERFHQELTAAGVPVDAKLSLALAPPAAIVHTEPDRRAAQRFADELWSIRGTPGIFSMAETPGPTTALPALPEVLTGWLRQADWSDAQHYLHQHLTELSQRDSIEAMRALTTLDPDNRVAAPYRAVLDLVDLAGGVAGPVAAADGAQPWIVPPGPVPPAFAFDYLQARPDRQARKPWNDQLLQMMYERAAFRELAVMLAWGVVERADSPTQGRRVGLDYGQGNAMAFAAVHHVLRMSVTRARTPGPTGSWPEIDAVDACVLDPLDKSFWIPRMDELRREVRSFGIPGHPERSGSPAPEHERLLNLLIERLVSC
ncbi:hypothetical protein [Micromonospora craniellae]|uniref:hypothetical protein n=1 Tax=Micromonospora craniellae TaxID=2294034 RepID=UPI0011C1BC1E|nr:hypothetical protein [Micromonospora craniellae]QOC93881.1 hypothetical protein ID554_09775 [Micromonospora craniellae]